MVFNLLQQWQVFDVDCGHIDHYSYMSWKCWPHAKSCIFAKHRLAQQSQIAISGLTSTYIVIILGWKTKSIIDMRTSDYRRRLMWQQCIIIVIDTGGTTKISCKQSQGILAPSLRKSTCFDRICPLNFWLHESLRYWLVITNRKV